MNIDLSYEYTNWSHEYVLGQAIGASIDIFRLAYFPSYAHVGSLPCVLGESLSVIKIMQTDKIDNFTICTHSNYNAKQNCKTSQCAH